MGMLSQMWVLTGVCARVAGPRGSKGSMYESSRTVLAETVNDSESAELWVMIVLCGFKGKPKLGGPQELENVLGNESVGFLVGVV